MDKLLGHVMTVDGSQVTVRLEAEHGNEDAIRIGAMAKMRSAGHDVVGTISAIQVESDSPGAPPQHILVVDLLGQIVPSAEGRLEFTRGVSRYPIPGAPVLAAADDDLGLVYARPSRSNIRIGTLYNDATRPAFVLVNELLAKHFAVLGTTGSGKSSAVTLILSAILADNPNAHIILLDPHNEYTTAFGELAHVINVDNLQLPFWLFNFEEALSILVRGGTAEEHESQAIILKEAITRARRHYAADDPTSASASVDTPVPFLISDLLRFLYDAMGKLDKADTSTPYMRLRTRIESLRADRRFAFMFSDWSTNRDSISQIAGRLMRIPVDGKPLSIVDLSGVPSEVTDVIVSLSCRIVFDFTVWSEPGRTPPILLVCEEAHRYVPANERIGFAATARAITRIAKEGRKYGLSLALVSQRPSEISTQVLSQCGTVFALQLGNDVDQDFISRVLPYAARGMVTTLPSLRAQEAIVSGEGVPLPMHIRFDDLPPERRPRSASAEFSKAWQTDSADAEFLNEGIRRWRLQSRAAR